MNFVFMKIQSPILRIIKNSNKNTFIIKFVCFKFAFLFCVLLSLFHHKISIYFKNMILYNELEIFLLI